MDGLDKIPAATAEDFAAFQRDLDYFSSETAKHRPGGELFQIVRVAAHYARRAAEAERLLRAFADIATEDVWHNQLDTACMAARKFLEAK